MSEEQARREAEFRATLANVTTFRENPFHPLVWIVGEPTFGKNVYIGGMSEVNASEVKVTIGDNCDIASFVSINSADSHRLTLGIGPDVDRGDITIEHNVFIGSHSMIKGGVHIGHHTVIAAGTIVDAGYIPPYSLVVGNPMKVKAGYYRERIQRASGETPQ